MYKHIYISHSLLPPALRTPLQHTANTLQTHTEPDSPGTFPAFL